jgi:hypothetical protein
VITDFAVRLQLSDIDADEGNPGDVRQRLTSYRARTEDFVFAKWFEGGGGNGRDGDGVADGVEDFDGITFRAVGRNVVVHELDDVTPFEAMLRHITRKHGIGVEFQFHGVPRLSGISVTNFVMPDKCSVIQMVRTVRVAPFGPFNVPRIS